MSRFGWTRMRIAGTNRHRHALFIEGHQAAIIHTHNKYVCCMPESYNTNILFDVYVFGPSYRDHGLKPAVFDFYNEIERVKGLAKAKMLAEQTFMRFELEFDALKVVEA